MSSRSLIIGGLVAFIALCCCALAVVMAAGAIYFFSADNSFARATPRPTRDPNATPAPAPTPAPAELAQMDTIGNWVIEQRGLQPSGEVTRTFLSEDQVLQRTLQDFNEDTTPEDWENSDHINAAVGLTEPGFDMYNILLRLYSEGVAGSYDPDTGELVIVARAGGLNAYDRVTYAHEYNHVLQDQNYRIRTMGFSQEGWDTDSEKAAGVQALLEGDSSLLEEQYKATLSFAEQREYDKVINSFDLSIYNEIPEYLLQDFFFPYSQGLEFVRRYYDKGGWARVDEVWKNPPVSTEHILHPERYEAGDLPRVVARPALTDTLGAGWHEIESNTMGEWYTYLILAYGVNEDARLSDRTAKLATEGWGGDGYVAYYNDDAQQIVFAQQWDWDTDIDTEEFTRAFTDYADKRFGSTQITDGHTCWSGDELNCLYFNGTHTLWLIAPDEATLNKVLSQYPDF